MTLRTTSQLAIDFPVDNASLPQTVTKIDTLTKRGYLVGPELVQALGVVGAAMDALAEPVTAPTGVYSGSAGAITQAYALLAEYPLAQSAPSMDITTGFNAVEHSVLAQYANLEGRAVDAISLGGQPLEGRGTNGLQRSKRYGDLSSVLLVTSTSALSASNFVTVTTPAFSSAYTAKPPTYALLKPSGSIVVGGTFHVGDVVSFSLGNGNIVAVTVTSPMATVAGVAAALNVAMSQSTGASNVAAVSMSGATLYFFGGSGAALSASVTGTSATITATASGSTLSGGGVVATGIVPGATVKDVGQIVNAAPMLQPYVEIAVIPATTASGVIALGGAWAAGQTLVVSGNITASYTTFSGDANMAGSANAFAAMLKAAVRANAAGGAGFTAFNAVASGAAITCTYGAAGTAGNSFTVQVFNTTTPQATAVTIIPTFTPTVPGSRNDALSGGTAGGLQLGPTTIAGATGTAL